MTQDEMATVNKLRTACQLRIATLQGELDVKFPLDEVNKLGRVLDTLFTPHPEFYGTDLTPYLAAAARSKSATHIQASNEALRTSSDQSLSGHLLPSHTSFLSAGESQGTDRSNSNDVSLALNAMLARPIPDDLTIDEALADTTSTVQDPNLMRSRTQTPNRATDRRRTPMRKLPASSASKLIARGSSSADGMGTTTQALDFSSGAESDEIDALEASPWYYFLTPTLQNYFLMGAKKRTELPLELPPPSEQSDATESKSEQKTQPAFLPVAPAGMTFYDMHREPKPPVTGSLLNPPSLNCGESSVSFYIEKIGLKDAPIYVDPYISVRVYEDGKLADLIQDTPVAQARAPQYLIFKQAVHLQIPLEKMTDKHVVVFELKHYKPEGGYVSTRCWSVMELREIVQSAGQPVLLEIYRKPTDPRIGKPSLHSIKPLYLHLMARIVKY